MNDHDRKKQELLEELAKRFRDSAHTLKSVARRINEASQLHHDTVHRMDRANTRLRECVDSQTAPLAFTYLEYLEFGSAEEFKKFKAMEVISDQEIETVDWDDLCDRLLQAC